MLSSQLNITCSSFAWQPMHFFHTLEKIVLWLQHAFWSLDINCQREINLPLVTQRNFEGGTRDRWKSLNKLRCHPGDLWVAVSGGIRGFYMRHIRDYSMCSCLWTQRFPEAYTFFLFFFFRKFSFLRLYAYIKK